ncbi:arginase [Gemmatimonas sp.]|uniref:arginase n=1 Tax=Gemmatimonas sp. TaxID=1962908 RepID=UPI0022CCD3D9|nr:arginase [Gemmatimonas sp.]MCZ8205331.1 arginase [Gemmatimonas sp.]
MPTVASPAASARAVEIIGVPLDLGASRRGVDMGPSAMRLSSLVRHLERLGCAVRDTGNVPVPDRAALPPVPGAFLQAITAVCADLARRTADAVRAGITPLVLGGDHSLAAGSVAGTATALHERGQRLGLIWLDAHADLNTPDTSLSGNVHGMPVAHLLGLGDPRLASLSHATPAVRPEHLVYVGLRDLDDAEKACIRQLGIRAFTMRDIDERGLRAVMDDAVTIATTGTGGVHLSCDADWVDPQEAPGVGTPVRGGATLREAHLAMEIIHDAGALLAMDLVEINPILDAGNATAELAAELIASAFGRHIL